jgi:hypothetical protein
VINRVPGLVPSLGVAFIVAVPVVGPKFATPLLAEGKVTTPGVSDVHVTATLVPLAVNVVLEPAWKRTCGKFPTTCSGQGVIVRPEVTLAVAVPITPLKLAVIVAEPPVPTSVALPAFAPEAIMATAQELEVVHVAEAVTFLLVLSEKAACAVKGCVWLEVRVGEFGVTVTEVGWFTKNPRQLTARANVRRAARAPIRRSFWVGDDIVC